MRYRTLGRTGWQISEVGFGAWAIGGSWGGVDDNESMSTLHRALDLGVNFFDTADVYGDGHSERLLARLKRERASRDSFYIVTKAGRRLNPHTADGYNKSNLTAFIDRSLQNLETDTLDLVQLHCPPTDVYYRPEVFAALDDLIKAGKLRHYGVSVERVEEALKAIEYPGVQSVQIIFNIVRQRPADLFFAQAEAKKVGILARLPLSSGLLTGAIDRSRHFAPDDHRAFNRKGESFDKGETFSGLDFDLQLTLVDRIKPLVPTDATLAQTALRWILDFPSVTTVIPGGRRPSQIEENARASDLPPLSQQTHAQLDALYEHDVKPLVHHLW
jgi:aryl-alcohol dehydrogenase-like predicted oxidoreductase